MSRSQAQVLIALSATVLVESELVALSDAPSGMYVGQRHLMQCCNQPLATPAGLRGHSTASAADQTKIRQLRTCCLPACTRPSATGLWQGHNGRTECQHACLQSNPGHAEQPYPPHPMNSLGRAGQRQAVLHGLSPLGHCEVSGQGQGQGCECCSRACWLHHLPSCLSRAIAPQPSHECFTKCFQPYNACQTGADAAGWHLVNLSCRLSDNACLLLAHGHKSPRCVASVHPLKHGLCKPRRHACSGGAGGGDGSCGGCAWWWWRWCDSITP